MTRRIASVALALVAFATGANAATLSMSTNQLIYNIGDTVTLTVTGDDGGASAYYMLGRLRFTQAGGSSAAGLLVNQTRTQTVLLGNSGPWLAGTLPAQDVGAVTNTALNQIVFPDQDTALNLPGTVALVTMLTLGPGVFNVNWEPDLFFFELRTAPGTSFTVVPEPATATLLGLSLIFLAASATRRAR